MYHRLIEDYLTHYHPQRKADLEREGTLQDYIDRQAEAMLAARRKVLAQLETNSPEISTLQREMEADQMVRELFLTPP